MTNKNTNDRSKNNKKGQTKKVSSIMSYEDFVKFGCKGCGG